MNQIVDKLLEFVFLLMLVQMIVFVIFLRTSKISVSGTAPINPILFKLAKVAMFACWIAVYVQSSGFYRLSLWSNQFVCVSIAAFLFLFGFIIQCIAYFNLGKNLKFGIPDINEQEISTLRTTGIYRFSRNPMYTGFFLMTIAAGLYVLNPLIWGLAVFSIIVHYHIVLREESFLKKTFGDEWLEYAKRVRRY
ncbi:MAG: isoprenylcysteine carboxylmethyltransferase family protein [Bacteroidales bacterium]|nr:isoprenylcysteine carboxylmethyltransferase family protein [Bacteroidales bacterium]